MVTERKLLTWLQQSINALLEKSRFANGDEFRPSQLGALQAYNVYLARKDLSTKDRLVGFFRIPTGVGKTAIFLGILNELYQITEAAGEELKTKIVAPRLNLLTQTKRAMIKYAPFLRGKVGVYGGGRKELDKPLTIMTYNAWVTLAESGKIASHNTHVLISDEAHRGLSERRIKNIFSNFDSTTVRLSFTATATYDTSKSVEHTHHNEIYGRDIRSAIEVGELAAYVRSQFYIIRVNSVKDEEEKLRNDPDLHLKLRQKAWTSRCIAILRNGIDAETGDPLSDGISGFYTANISHAVHTETELNKDKTLASKAKKLGFDGVAIALHSKMPGVEQKRRLEAFEIGRYMSLVGDEMLKEGHDHPPLKNIFDWQRNSAVDKAQIIGRGLRKYYDKTRKLWLGSNIIDTVVYVGHEDADIEAERREYALRCSVKAWDILDGTIIYCSGKAPKELQQRTYSTTRLVDIDGQSVEAAVTLTEINTIKALVDGLSRSNFAVILLDEKIESERFTPRQRLQKEQERTGIGSKAMMAKLAQKTDSVDGLSIGVVESWLRNYKVLSARLDWFNLVMGTYANEQIFAVYLDKKIANDLLTPREKLNKERERTGMGAKAVFTQLEQTGTLPQGLSWEIIKSWLIKFEIKSARSDWFELVMNVYVESGNKISAVALDIKALGESLTPREQLNEARDRTGIGSKALVRELKQTGKMPDDLSLGIINSWFNNCKVKYARPDLFEAIINFYHLKLNTSSNPDRSTLQKSEPSFARNQKT